MSRGRLVVRAWHIFSPRMIRGMFDMERNGEMITLNSMKLSLSNHA